MRAETGATTTVPPRLVSSPSALICPSRANLKTSNAEQFNYYRELIRLRNGHPAFRMTTAEDIARNLVFDSIASLLPLL